MRWRGVHHVEFAVLDFCAEAARLDGLRAGWQHR
jgi:hypothetical protein